jgi:dihydroneopterin aldolase
MDTIFIDQIKVETIIGVYEPERITKQPLLIDLEMQYDTSQAIASDNLRHALDYHKITTDIHAFVSQSSFQLIEALAQAIAMRVLKNKTVKTVSVSLSKPMALDQAKTVGIRIKRQNS